MCVRPEPELPALANDLHRFYDDSSCSSWMWLRTLGAALLVGRVVLRLFLACVPLPDVVTGDASTSITPSRDAADALLAGWENHVSACSSWFSLRLSESTLVAIQGEYFNWSNSISFPWPEELKLFNIPSTSNCAHLPPTFTIMEWTCCSSEPSRVTTWIPITIY